MQKIHTYLVYMCHLKGLKFNHLTLLIYEKRHMQRCFICRSHCCHHSTCWVPYSLLARKWLEFQRFPLFHHFQTWEPPTDNCKVLSFAIIRSWWKYLTQKSHKCLSSEFVIPFKTSPILGWLRYIQVYTVCALYDHYNFVPSNFLT